MRAIRVIGAVNIILGLIFAVVPIEFYKMVKALFTPSIQPPLGWGTIWSIVVVLWIPTLALILSGAALLLVDEKLINVPEYEVYTEMGKFVGGLKKVRMVEGEVESFVVDEEEGEEEILEEDVVAGDDVILVKEERTRRHPSIGKEVYTERGDFLGYVVEAKVDSENNLLELEVERGEFKSTVKKPDIISIERVILVK
ncbi:MAG: PRC-barrel domain-containing protein [Candidatus Hydrothermarchaeales archaeon]